MSRQAAPSPFVGRANEWMELEHARDSRRPAMTRLRSGSRCCLAKVEKYERIAPKSCAPPERAYNLRGPGDGQHMVQREIGRLDDDVRAALRGYADAGAITASAATQAWLLIPAKDRIRGDTCR